MVAITPQFWIRPRANSENSRKHLYWLLGLTNRVIFNRPNILFLVLRACSDRYPWAGGTDVHSHVIFKIDLELNIHNLALLGVSNDL